MNVQDVKKFSVCQVFEVEAVSAVSVLTYLCKLAQHLLDK